MGKPRDSEIDFLMEVEFRLQSDLNKVHERLEELLAPIGETATRHLVLLQGGSDGTPAP